VGGEQRSQGRPQGAEGLLRAYRAHREALASLPSGAEEAARLRGRLRLSPQDQARLAELTGGWSDADRDRFEACLASGTLLTW
jgi:hypothetical protein